MTTGANSESETGLEFCLRGLASLSADAANQNFANQI